MMHRRSDGQPPRLIALIYIISRTCIISRTILSCAIISCAIVSCTTLKRSGRNEDLAPTPTDKPGSQAVKIESLSTAIKTPSEREQMAFVTQQSSPRAIFNAESHAFVASLPNSPEPGSVTEAALAIGLVKTILYPLHSLNTHIEEQDLAHAPNQAKPSSPPPVNRDAGLTLEGLCKERGINLADAVVENPLLHSYPIAKQVSAALEHSSGSPEFKKEILLALKRQASQWSGLGQELESPQEVNLPAADAAQTSAPAPAAVTSLPPNSPAATTNDAAVAPSGAVPAASTPSTSTPAGTEGSDANLSEAQTLADRGEYQAAITKAQSVANSSPHYASAQSKIKEFSELAVQDLRRKAAAAFQTAMPLSDKRLRTQYLEQAKNYLEQALEGFPQATQLPTVRDNLKVISRDLEKLQGNQQGG